MQRDAELVDLAMNGNKAAYASLVRRYERAAYAVAVQVLQDGHLAEDAVQEAFLRVYGNLGSLRDGQMFGPWLLKIARNEALTFVRREATRAQSLEKAVAVSNQHQTDQLDEQSRLLLSAIMRLPEQQRCVVILRYFDGHPVRTIAQMMNRSVGTITKQLSRAHKRLRKQLKELE